jgi:hypothetical protein
MVPGRGGIAGDINSVGSLPKSTDVVKRGGGDGARIAVE